jgi:aspartate carbamoyltransferase catalytic subunit
MNEHPTQGLLDAYTVWSENRTKKWRIAFFGDVARSRVARSNLHLFKRLGYSVSVVDDQQLTTRLFAKAFQLPLIKRSALKALDIVYALRVQRERGSLAVEPALSLEDLGPKTFWMHPGPIVMGEDLSPDLCDASHPRSFVLKQKENGFLVRRLLLKNLVEKIIKEAGSRS